MYLFFFRNLWKCHHTRWNRTFCWRRFKYYTFTFSRHFYPKRHKVHSGYTFFCQYVCSLGIEPTTFALLTQCSTTEPHVILSCSYFSADYLYWYRQNPRSAPEFLVLIFDGATNTKKSDVDPRLSVKLTKWEQNVPLLLYQALLCTTVLWGPQRQETHQFTTQTLYPVRKSKSSYSLKLTLWHSWNKQYCPCTLLFPSDLIGSICYKKC